jgi:hypothetical protein
VKLTPIQLGEAGPLVERIAGLTLHEPRVRVVSGMNIAIALAQFIMLALATMASHILVNSGSVPTPPVTWSDIVTTFVANQGLWFLVIPAVWLLFAGWCEKTKSSVGKIAQPIGVGIAVAILAVIVLVLVS